LRDAIAEELRTRCELVTGVTAQRLAEEQTTNLPVLVVVAILSEDKRPIDCLFYSCTVRIGLTIIVRHEDADQDLDGGNAARYLDRIMTAIEQQIHASPWPNEELVNIVGHQAIEPDNTNTLANQLRIEVGYRHNLDDPETYDPSYTP